MWDARKGRGRTRMRTARQRRRPWQTGCRRLAAVDRPSLSGARRLAARSPARAPPSPAPRQRTSTSYFGPSLSYARKSLTRPRIKGGYVISDRSDALAPSPFRGKLFIFCERRQPAAPASRPPTMKTATELLPSRAFYNIHNVHVF